MKQLILASLLTLTSGIAYSQENQTEEYQYQIPLLTNCTSAEFFVKKSGELGYKPIIEFVPPNGNTSAAMYLFVKDSGEFLIAMPSNNPGDVCVSQTGIISKLNKEQIFKFLGISSI